MRACTSPFRGKAPLALALLPLSWAFLCTWRARANGCTPRARARGRGTHSGCTWRARWASLCTSCERDGSAKSRPPSRPIVLPSISAARAPRVAVSYGGVGGRSNGCTPRARVRGRGTHSGCTRRARWASLCTPCERGGSAKSRPRSRPIVLPSVSACTASSCELRRRWRSV